MKLQHPSTKLHPARWDKAQTPKALHGGFWNLKLGISLVLGCWCLVLSFPSHASLFTYDFTGINGSIPDGSANGYQNSQSVDLGTLTGSTTTEITDVNVTLNVSGGYNGDLYGYLVHSSGFAVLLNRPGRTSGNSFGYSDTGFNITFDGQAANDNHLYQNFSPSYNGNGQLTGTWQEDGRNANPNTVTDGSSRGALLSSFNTLNANGSWTLFLADMSGGEQSTLVSWGLQISTVPEPTTVALAIFAALVGGVTLVRRLTRKV